MVSALGARHHGVGLACEVEQILRQRRFDERHVARDHEHRVAARVGQRGVQTAERPAARDEVLGDDENIVRQQRELGNLTITNRAAVDDQRALVAAAEARGLSAVQNGCGEHAMAAAILS